MDLLGTYHIVLSPDADEQAFVARMAEGPQPLLTRVTSRVRTRLLKRENQPGRYAWEVAVSSMSDRYGFVENVERLREHIKGFGDVLDFDSYTVVREDG